MYIGTKSTAADASFLARNGLVGGQSFQFDPVGDTIRLPASGSLAGTFATSTSEPLVEDKFEDVHVNPNNPVQAVVADQTAGVYQLDLDLNIDANGTLDTSSSSFEFTLLNSVTGSDELRAPDNVDWSEDGYIYVNEDGSDNDVWQQCGRLRWCRIHAGFAYRDQTAERFANFDEAPSCGYTDKLIALRRLFRRAKVIDSCLPEVTSILRNFCKNDSSTRHLSLNISFHKD